MMPVTNGRHCQSCCKTVTDFTMMSNDEIVAYLSANSKNVCGRFYSRQIDNINVLYLQQVNEVSRFRNYRIAALFAALLTFFKAEAHDTAKCAVKMEQHSVSLIRDTLNKNPARFIEITGTVHSSADGEIIPGVIIKVVGTNISTITDSKGYFALSVPVGAKFMEFHFVGYETKRIKVKSIKKKRYNIQLSLAEIVLGEIAIVND
jgi:hypothetical protein